MHSFLVHPLWHSRKSITRCVLKNFTNMHVLFGLTLLFTFSCLFYILFKIYASLVIRFLWQMFIATSTDSFNVWTKKNETEPSSPFLKDRFMFTWVRFCHLMAARQAVQSRITCLSLPLFLNPPFSGSQPMSFLAYLPALHIAHLLKCTTHLTVIYIPSLCMAKPTQSACSHYFTNNLNPKSAFYLFTCLAISQSRTAHPPHHAVLSTFQPIHIIFKYLSMSSCMCWEKNCPTHNGVHHLKLKPLQNCHVFCICKATL